MLAPNLFNMLWEDEMKRLLAFVAVLGCVPVLLNCGGESNAAVTPPEALFTVLAEGTLPQGGGYTKKQSKVISGQADYATELAVYSSATPASLDFVAGQVLLVDMGPRNTGGYSIRVTSVNVANDWVVANVELVKPGPQCIVTLALTNPYQFVYIPTRKEVLLSEVVRVTSC